jgi:hypothetical protein
MERPGTLSGTTTTLHRISRASEGVSLVLADKIITGLLGASPWEASFPEERRAGRAGCRHRGGPEHARASARLPRLATQLGGERPRPRAVADRDLQALRHANPQVTSTVYADLTDEGVKGLVEKLAALA